MSEKNHNHHLLEGQDHITVHHEHKPYWKRVHHTWSFWIFLFLMLAAMIYYMLSGNLSRWPYYIQPQQAPSSAVGK